MFSLICECDCTQFNVDLDTTSNTLQIKCASCGKVMASVPNFIGTQKPVNQPRPWGVSPSPSTCNGEVSYRKCSLSEQIARQDDKETEMAINTLKNISQKRGEIARKAIEQDNVSRNISKDDETMIMQAVGGAVRSKGEYGEIIKGASTPDNPLPPDEVRL